jgi:hypothetical protein
MPGAEPGNGDRIGYILQALGRVEGTLDGFRERFDQADIRAPRPDRARPAARPHHGQRHPEACKAPSSN